MIVDFRRLPAGYEVDAEVCIVGTGPAGLALGREFFGTSTKVVVLEAGGLGFEPASEALNAGDSVGLRHLGLTEGRRRQFGGAANTWGAVCVELDGSDFVKRPWIPGSGWPITAADVAPFYDRARAMFKLPRTDYDETDWRSLGMETASFDPAALRFSVVPTTPVSDLGKAYRNEFSTASNVHVVLHANVTGLHTNADGTAVDAVEFRSLENKQGKVRARAIVLCCGGIENTRLLLMSRDAQRKGLGNGYNLVGRYLTDHTFSFSARIIPPPGKTLVPLFRVVNRGGSNLRPRLSLTAQNQERAGVLNCMAQVCFEHSVDSGFVAAHNLRRAIRFRRMPEHLRRDVINIVRHPRELTALAIDRYVRGRHPADAASQLLLQCMAEQLPDAESRVTLSERRDRFGLPLPVVHWRAADLERRTIAYMTDTVSAEFLRLDLGQVEPQSWLRDDGTTAWQSHLVEGYHHMGTTRMSASAASGVVDAQCELHDVAGLFVAGTSIFPAAGFANPTLTIVALAIRLADYLKRRLRAPLVSIDSASLASASRPSAPAPEAPD